MMRKFMVLWVALVVLVFQVGLTSHARADAAGKLTVVEGRVDVLRGGKLPAAPLKVGDEVQVGDVLRTKSLSKAEITFVDKSTMMISPESRVAIEEYMYDAAKKKRNAVVKLFQGLAHVVVQKVSKVVEPDFVVKTHTAIMGIRGTEFGIRLQPNSSTVLDFDGVIQVGNIFPEVGQLFPRAPKVAFSWGGAPQRWVFLKKMQGTTVGRGLPPTLPFNITAQDQQQFLHQMATGLISQKVKPGSNTGAGGGGGGAGGTTATFVSNYDSGTSGTGTGTGTGGGGVGDIPGGAGNPVGNLNIVNTPPPVVPPTTTTTTTTTTQPRRPSLPPPPPAK